jgi:predicted AlkP superfamily phosphohydrolase/phosphomutase
VARANRLQVSFRFRTVVALLVFFCANSCLHSPRDAKSLIVLGIDGMDPGFVESHWSSLPALARLKQTGRFVRLATTVPPQSPVAWSSFITGTNPDRHGIFDFVHRDPKTLQPFSSDSETEEPRWQVPFGPYLLPLSSARIKSLRRGKAFWERLAERNVPVMVMRMPANYPPIPVGKTLSGMGTPDLQGTLGTFSFFTNAVDETTHEVPGGRIIKVQVENGRTVLTFPGPPNTIRRDHRSTSTSITVDIDSEHNAARVLSGERVAVLNQGEWSDWLPADFTLLEHVASVHGMFRVYLKAVRPDFELYVSPVNMDPAAPALPVVHPADWGKVIARDIGPFFTLGIPEDTAALRSRVFDLHEFREQAGLVLKDEQALLHHSLGEFQHGLLFFYFSAVDQNSHVLWKRHEEELLTVYRAMDAAVTEIQEKKPNVPLIVLSDHGFSSFERAVNLNTWLGHRGFLTTKFQTGEKNDLTSIDWTSTEAYALGLNGLYLNMRGREAHGTVQWGEARRALLANLREQLLAWRDAANGKPVISAVYQTHPAAQNTEVAPDLIVGYSPGYRASWQTGLGGVPSDELEDNTDAWIADHCIDPTYVPGVLFTSQVPVSVATLPGVSDAVLRYFDAK